MSDQNKALVRSFLDAFNSGNIDGIDAFVTDDYAYHGAGQELQGVDAVKGLMSMYKGAFSDATLIIEDQIAEGDRVVTRARATGTNDGALEGIPPSGAAIDIPLISIHRVENGRLAEEWEVFAELQMLQAIGVIPTEEAATV